MSFAEEKLGKFSHLHKLAQHWKGLKLFDRVHKNEHRKKLKARKAAKTNS